MEQLLRNIYKFFQRIDAGVTTPDKFPEEFPIENSGVKISKDSYDALCFYTCLISKTWVTYSLEDFDFLKNWDYRVVGTTDRYICTLSKLLCEIVEEQPTVNTPARIEPQATNETHEVEPVRAKFESAETLKKELFMNDEEISMIKVEVTALDIETLVRQSGRLGVDPLVSILYTYIKNQEKNKTRNL